MDDRYFGVEIEHGNRLGEHNVAQRLLTAFPELFEPGYNNYTLTVGYDGSGVEVRTPPLIGPEGFRTLKSLFAFLKRIGGYTTERDGMHVHFNAPEFQANPELIVVLAKNWVANEQILRPFVHSRRWGRSSCPSDLLSDPNAIQNLEARVAQGDSIANIVQAQSSRGALNLTNLPYRGTIEVRLHEGTLEYTQAAAWIRFCIAFINASAEGKLIHTCSTQSELLDQVKPHSTAKRQLTRRALGEVIYA